MCVCVYVQASEDGTEGGGGIVAGRPMPWQKDSGVSDPLGTIHEQGKVRREKKRKKDPKPS